MGSMAHHFFRSTMDPMGFDPRLKDPILHARASQAFVSYLGFVGAGVPWRPCYISISNLRVWMCMGIIWFCVDWTGLDVIKLNQGHGNCNSNIISS